MKIQENFEFKIAYIFIAVIVTLAFHANAQSVFVGQTGKEGKALIRFVDPSELKKIVDHPVDSIWIVDVRTEKAYSNGHIPTAKSYPSGIIMDRLNEIPKDKYLILYCTVGGTVKMVMKKLKKAGYKRCMNWGGLSRWEWDKETGIVQKYGS